MIFVEYGGGSSSGQFTHYPIDVLMGLLEIWKGDSIMWPVVPVTTWVAALREVDYRMHGELVPSGD